MNSRERSIWSMLCWPRAGRLRRRIPMQKKLFPRLAIVLASALLLAACGGGGSSSVSSDDVAVVGGQHITKAQYDQLLAQAKLQFKQNGRAVPEPGDDRVRGSEDAGRQPAHPGV